MVAVVAWACARIVAVNVWLTPYGVNVWVFATVEIMSSVPYGLGTAWCVSSLIDRRLSHAVWWGVLAACAYVAPDVYMLSAGENLPVFSVVVIVALMATLGTTTVVSLFRRVRSSRAMN